MPKFIYNIRNHMFTAYRPHWVDAENVEVDWHEREAMRKGATWEDICAKRRENAAGERAPAPEPVKPAAHVLEIPDVEPKPDSEPVTSVSMSIPANIVRKIALDKAEAGEPDALGDEKRTFSGVGHWNVTLDMLAQVKDEELHQFAKHALEKDYPEIPALATDDEKREAYEFMRKDIATKVKRMMVKRGRRAEQKAAADKARAAFKEAHGNG